MPTVKDTSNSDRFGLRKALDTYFEAPNPDNLTAFEDILSKEEHSQLESFLQQKQWLVQLSKVLKDDRVKAILTVFEKYNFKAPKQEGLPSNLIPFYVHPKRRAALRLEDFIAHPNVLTWDEVYSDHKPQLIHCSTEQNKSFDVVTYNVALTGPLIVNDINDPDNNVRGNLWKSVPEGFEASKEVEKMYFEREKRLIQTLQKRAISAPILLLQETTETFVKNLQKNLGDDWEFKFSKGNIATLWNTKEISFMKMQEDPKLKISSIEFNYQDETCIISNGHLSHADKATEGEEVLNNMLKESNNHFFCGDFNRRLPPLDDGFHHNGTGNNFAKFREEYDCTDGGFTFRKNKIVRLPSQIIDEQTGCVVKCRDVSVAEALKSDTYQECIFPQNYDLDGFHEKIAKLNIEMSSMTLEKNIYNVSRVTLKSQNNIIYELAKEFPYLEEPENKNGEFTYVIYTSPLVMQVKLINEIKQNSDINIEPLIKAIKQVLSTNVNASLKQQALNDFKACTDSILASKSKLSTGFKISTMALAMATTALIALAVVFLPPLGIAAGITALMGVGLVGIKGIVDRKEAKKITELVNEVLIAGQQSINNQVKPEMPLAPTSARILQRLLLQENKGSLQNLSPEQRNKVNSKDKEKAAENLKQAMLTRTLEEVGKNNNTELEQQEKDSEIDSKSEICFGYGLK
ncbi:hypothetical protein Lgra_0686 [Legionella gratiana]|uniref:Endonuclease/exonuclease/phosphatase domain-containing protein n=1 Tax=Legionella gratiana TaxID=45066 RepID=A0A378J242_9GAMM|nr:hypothetical protein [Legionella gratiana]KTD14655.1 hypothetical protein Lgra_0686 [Legionella gratiana]STX41599.1 Uncharacterised protein [Legionella gratiana]